MTELNRLRGIVRAGIVWAAAAASIGLGGCASMYVDGNLPETPKAEFRKPAEPPAVQLVFEFQTKGAPNARATDFLKAQVAAQVQDSGLFASTTAAPGPGTGLLTISVNNVPLSDDVASKGFIAGLTFGLAGSTVADGYDATLRYAPPAAGAAAVKIEAKHVIHTSIGTGSPPPGAIKAGNAEASVRLMMTQLVSRLLANLSKDPAFPAGNAGATPAAEAAKQL